jgi:hypothetical protein
MPAFGTLSWNEPEMKSENDAGREECFDSCSDVNDHQAKARPQHRHGEIDIRLTVLNTKQLRQRDVER